MLQRLCLLSAAKRQPGRRHLPLRTLGGSSSWLTVLSKPQRIRPPINHRHRCPLTEADPAADGAIDDGRKLARLFRGSMAKMTPVRKLSDAQDTPANPLPT